MQRKAFGVLMTGLLVVAGGHAAEARISKITITSVAPADGGVPFGANGPYRLVNGIATGEVDPKDRRNAIIQDIGLAPRNAKGMVEYSTQFQILMPADPAKGNRTLYFEILNRERQIEPGNLAAHAGEAFLQDRGFTMVWAGWQADMAAPPSRQGAPAPAAFVMKAPVATDKDKEITGPVRAEWTPAVAASTENISMPDSNLNTLGYPPVTLDNKGLTLTARVTQNGARSVIPNSDWAFADCGNTPFPGTPNPLKICLKTGFDTNHIYELVYVAKNPIVMGLGLAAIRDVGAFFRRAARDDSGTANPLAGRIDHTLVMGISQSGRVLRTFLQLGFNEDEQGRIVYDGAQPHISVAGDSINVRFAQPGRLAGTQHIEAQYPGSESSVTYDDQSDPVFGKSTGILDRCRATNTCPKIIQTISDVEYWQSSGRADTTDAQGKMDLAIPDNARIYQFSSNQHGGYPPYAPLPTDRPAGCEQRVDANTYTYNFRAMQMALEAWVVNGTLPPPSRYARLDDHTLVPLKSVAFPKIPGASGPLGIAGLSGPEGVFNTRFAYDRGPRFDSQTGSGILDIEPPKRGAQYPSLVPQVDADGNDIGGVRSHILQAPLGTYAGWNLRSQGHGRGDSCDLTGSFIPFAVTAKERAASGDPRLSLEERYRNSAGYVKAVTAAVNRLVAERYMLASDAEGAIDNAAAWFRQAAKGELP